MPTSLTPRFYPSLASFVDPSHIGKFKLPPAVAEFLTEKFSHIFVKDFQFSKSLLGDNGFYSCSVISKSRLGVEIPGTAQGDEPGIMLVLNPDHDPTDDSHRSVFPITLGYNWPILAYLRSVDFDLDTSGQSGSVAGQLFDIALNVLRLSDKQVLAHAINTFCASQTEGVSSIDQFIIDYNNYATSVDIAPIGPLSGSDKLGELLTQMRLSVQQEPVLSILGMYLSQHVDGSFSWEETKKKLNRFFRGLLPSYDMESYLLDLMLPKFSASLELSAAIEFPRHIIIPAVVQTITEGEGEAAVVRKKFNAVTDENAKFSLQFQPATFEYHSQRGFTNDLELSLSSGDYYGILGKSGLVIKLDDLKLDLSNERNIPEAMADGRSEFKGVYVGNLDVYLPKGFSTNDDQSMALRARRVLIGPPDGISGIFELVNTSEDLVDAAFKTRIGEMEIDITDFYLEMSKNSVLDFHGGGILKLPGSANEIAFAMSFNNDTDTFRIEGSYTGSIALGDNTATITGNLALPENDPSFGDEVFVVEFDKSGVKRVAGSLAMSFGSGENEIELTASIGYNADTEEITISASDINGLAFDFGPVHIQPLNLGISFGGGQISDIDTECLVSIRGVKAVLADGSVSANDALFHATYSDSAGTKTIELANSAPGVQPTAARILGFDLELTDLHIEIENGSLTVCDGEGTIMIPPQEEGDEPVVIGFGLEHIDGSIKLDAYTDSVLSIGQVDLQMVDDNPLPLNGEIPLSITIGNGGISAASASFWLSFPKGKQTNEADSEVVKVRIDGEYDNGQIEFAASFVDNNPELHFGAVQLRLNSVQFALANGKINGIGIGGSVLIDGCYNDEDETIPTEINVLISADDDIVTIAAEIDPENVPTLYLRSVKIGLTAFQIKLNRNGILPESMVSGLIELENDAFNDVPIGVKFTFLEEGFDALLTGQLDLLSNDVITILLDRFKLGKLPNRRPHFEIGGEITTDISVPMLSKIIPHLIDINKVGFEYDENDNSHFIYDLKLKWEGGFEITGSDATGFGGYIPLDGLSSLAGDTISIDKILLKISENNGPALNVEFYGLNINIGPFTGIVDGMGLQAVLEERPNPNNPEWGNFGRNNLDIKFLPPKGIGVSIYSPPVAIAGYLFLDNENERYYGYLSIDVNSLGLDAIGIYAKTEDGYSFLALVTVDLPNAIPLVFGFYLQGVGGIVALHRGLNPDAMRDGVRNGTLDQVFFPENIIDNMDTVLQQLEAFFPEQHGVHSFGLLFDLTYGESDMVHLEVGLLIRTKPFLVGIGGTVKIVAPDPEKHLVVLNCAFLGIFDQGAKLITFDARIYDSSIAGIGIEGDIAVRLGWGDNKMFVITVGGFHPQFVPDTTWKLGTINRIALRIKDTEELKIFAESYFAVTSNTFQIGAKAMLTYEGGGFKVEAYNGFDALFYFNPFHFTVSISAGAEVAWKGFNIAAVHLSGSLSGPGVWNARGSASFEIGPFNPSFNFDISWGDTADQGLPAVNVQPILLAELSKNGAWKGTGMRDGQVTLRPVDQPAEDEDATLILCPKDSLSVNQLVVPLEVIIQKYGENPISGTNYFKIRKIRIGTGSNSQNFSDTSLQNTEDYFAPNQFKSLSEQQRLQSASYDLMKSGAGISNTLSLSIPEHYTSREITYEQFYKGATENPGESLASENNQLQLSGNVQRQQFSKGGALGRNKQFRSEVRKNFRSNKVRVKETEYSIVKKNDLEKWSNSIVVNSKTQALELLANTDVISAVNARQLRVAPRFEYFNNNGMDGQLESIGSNPN